MNNKKNGAVAPQSYSGWTELIDSIDADTDFSVFEEALSVGVCPEYSCVKQYFHEHVEEAVNRIISSGLSELKRNVRMLSENGEITSVHLAFIRFSRKVKNCLFFNKITFLDEDYKAKLNGAVADEIERFRKQALSSLKNDVKRSGSGLLEEELFLIKRIKFL